jgi:hypothetical protein
MSLPIVEKAAESAAHVTGTGAGVGAPVRFGTETPAEPQVGAARTHPKKQREGPILRIASNLRAEESRTPGSIPCRNSKGGRS